MMARWHLRYPVESEEQRCVLRHHLSLLRDDGAVQNVEVADDADRPDMMHVRVTFLPTFTRPHRTELQALDQMYGATSRQDQLLAFVKASRGADKRRTWYDRILDDD